MPHHLTQEIVRKFMLGAIRRNDAKGSKVQGQNSPYELLHHPVSCAHVCFGELIFRGAVGVKLVEWYGGFI